LRKRKKNLKSNLLHLKKNQLKQNLKNSQSQKQQLKTKKLSRKRPPSRRRSQRELKGMKLQVIRLKEPKIVVQSLQLTLVP